MKKIWTLIVKTSLPKTTDEDGITGLSTEVRTFEAFEKAKRVKGKPTVIIAKTIKGKGVSFMENQAGWHGKAPNDEQLLQALEDLK